jgi:hypothetical protein
MAIYRWLHEQGLISQREFREESHGSRGKKEQSAISLWTGVASRYRSSSLGQTGMISQLKAVLANKIAEPIMDAAFENLCSDAGYAGEAACKVNFAAGYKLHVRPRGEKQREKLENPSSRRNGWSLRPAILGSTDFENNNSR